MYIFMKSSFPKYILENCHCHGQTHFLEWGLSRFGKELFICIHPYRKCTYMYVITICPAHKLSRVSILNIQPPRHPHAITLPRSTCLCCCKILHRYMHTHPPLVCVPEVGSINIDRLRVRLVCTILHRSPLSTKY